MRFLLLCVGAMLTVQGGSVFATDSLVEIKFSPRIQKDLKKLDRYEHRREIEYRDNRQDRDYRSPARW